MQQPNNRQGSDRIGSDRQDFAFNLTRLQQLKSLLPEIFCENEIDFDKFKALFSEQIATTPDRYMLNWAGKSEAYHTLQSPSFKTLTPCPQESVNFENSDNIFIEGENLDVLKILQKSYFNSVKMIYIDPPYNTGNDFVYHDNFASRLDDYQQQSGEKDENGLLKKAFVRNSKENGHYHSNWLNMMLPRLHLAKNLLKDDGVIFISIDDNEQAQLKLLCDEVFGEENFVACVSRSTGTPTGGGGLSQIVNELDYLLVYSKSSEVTLSGLEMTEEEASIYDRADEKGKYLIRPLRRTGGEDRREDRPTMYYALQAPDNSLVYPIAPAGYESRWICGQEKYNELLKNELIEWKNNQGKWTVYQKFYLEGRLKQAGNLWADVEGNKKATRDVKNLFNNTKVFDFPKPIGFLSKILKISTNSDDLILDFFAGSCTTAHAVMQLNAKDNGNRRFICVQMPELTDEKSEAFKAGFKNIAEISKERIRRAGKQIAENNPDKPLDTGFKVFKLSDSHFKQWQSPNMENLAQQLEFFIDPVADFAEPQAMLYEILLRLGLKLSIKVRLENDVFWLDDENGKRYAILLSEANEALFNQIIEQQPLKVVMLDRLFNGNDALKKNTELQFADHHIQFLVI
ncbi:site-specific DNA-methyltransferase [Lonepinella koalarum]|uniref:site-specific DNA-methyltransferase (adenine-specific) n=2 Tax=Lonepinella koalarum TaxID=53417 RepID=A0A4R1KX78_9PAST|nr:adenine-specific DNA-methyltransferase [Lonepinella koalarum]TFJ90425.1 site-specific DNA-methyltransferase [Lonepinella koalarum]